MILQATITVPNLNVTENQGGNIRALTNYARPAIGVETEFDTFISAFKILSKRGEKDYWVAVRGVMDPEG